MRNITKTNGSNFGNQNSKNHEIIIGAQKKYLDAHEIIQIHTIVKLLGIIQIAIALSGR